MADPHRPVLAVNTTFKGIALGAFQPEGQEAPILSQRFIEKSHSAALKLPALVDEVLSEAQVAWPQLGGIVVAHGPGSFTGIKIGLAFVQGLAAAAQQAVPVLGVDALSCLVRHGSPSYRGQPWLLPQNRRKGYLYAADAPPRAVWLAPQLGLTPLSAPLASDPSSEPWPVNIAAIGLVTPWQELKDALPQAVVVTDAEPSALGQATLTAMVRQFDSQRRAGQLEAAGQLAANYITPSTPEERQLAQQKS